MFMTERQKDVLSYLKTGGVATTGHDGSVLNSLAKKGLAHKHYNTAPGYVYYTCTLTATGKALAAEIQAAEAAI